MRRQGSQRKRAIDLIRRVVNEVELVETSKEQMLKEVKMMSFKVRTIAGDVFTLTEQEPGLLETLWRLGKIEGILNADMDNLKEEERETVFRYLDGLEIKHHQKVEQSLQKLSPKTRAKVKVVKLEIFKDPKQSHGDYLN